jgi:coatomer subunit beta'
MQIRVYNYNTMEKVKTFEAHTDYIRSLAIHPTLPLVLSSSDDMFIKLWDWEKGTPNYHSSDHAHDHDHGRTYELVIIYGM